MDRSCKERSITSTCDRKDFCLPPWMPWQLLSYHNWYEHTKPTLTTRCKQTTSMWHQREQQNRTCKDNTTSDELLPISSKWNQIVHRTIVHRYESNLPEKQPLMTQKRNKLPIMQWGNYDKDKFTKNDKEFFEKDVWETKEHQFQGKRMMLAKSSSNTD